MAHLIVQAGGLWNPTVRAPGGASATGIELVVSVTRDDGTPVTGLIDSDFDVAVFDRPPSTDSPPLVSGRPRRVHLPIVAIRYLRHGGLAARGGVWGDAMVVIVTDVTSGADSGRAVLNIEF